MPEMDGFELAELMRGSERTRAVPIIFVTAGVHDQVRIFRGYESGAVDFLYKPIEPNILRNKAEVFFQLYRHKQQLARELRERTETLRLNEMFTAVLGHDLRNPLNAVVTGAQLLQHRSDDPAVKSTAGKMLSSARRMGRMIDDMLDLARARLAGGIPLKRERADLAPLIDRVVHEHRAAAPDRPIAVSIEGDCWGDWDADRLAQVVSNLVGNAVRHGDASAPIKVTVDGAPGAVSVAVSNGGQIAADTLPYIFDPFRGGERGLGRSEGLGLGLYIVQQLVQAHRGRIVVVSENGETTFRIELPRHALEVVKL
jgi:signal transduction histidine kinase